jgi:hypothetical protein
MDEIDNLLTFVYIILYIICKYKLKEQKDMEQKQSLYDMDHPFYYNPHPDSEVDENKEDEFYEITRRIFYGLFVLVLFFIILAAVCGIKYLMKTC